jgi:hypothetical protein
MARTATWQAHLQPLTSAVRAVCLQTIERRRHKHCCLHHQHTPRINACNQSLYLCSASLSCALSCSTVASSRTGEKGRGGRRVEADSSCNGRACDRDSGTAVAATSPISLSSNLPLCSDIEAANLQQMTYRKTHTTHDVNTFAQQAQLCPSRLQASAIHAPHAVPRIFATNLRRNARQRVGHTAPADNVLKKLNSHKT